jgi:hypothetical protein
LEKNKYVGSKWGRYLRAPDIFFKILEKGKDKLVPLKQIAEVKFGIKTGADDWFYLTDSRVETLGIEKRFLRPILTDPDLPGILVQSQNVTRQCIFARGDKRNFKGTSLLKWIIQGETREFGSRPALGSSIPAFRPTCRSRARWYELPDRKPSPILWIEVKKRRSFTLLNNADVLADRSFYDIIPYKYDAPLICALLNCTLVAIFCEIAGNAPGGSGAGVQMTVAEVKKLLVLSPEHLNDEDRAMILSSFGEMCKRDILPLEQEVLLPDRHALDKVVFKTLGLTEEELLELYKAVVDLVKSRVEKAKSFGTRKKTREGIDVDLLSKTFMEKVGDDTLGKFYKEKVLSQKPLYTKTLPRLTDDIAIRQSLLGWRLYSGKKYIDCASELEARYLTVWLEAGKEKVKVPKDEAYLKAIVPELENLKAKIDAFIESHLGFITNLKTRDRILRQLWLEITKGVRSD